MFIVATKAEVHSVFHRLNTGILVSNPASGIDTRPRFFSVFLSAAKALKWANFLFKDLQVFCKVEKPVLYYNRPLDIAHERKKQKKISS